MRRWYEILGREPSKSGKPRPRRVLGEHRVWQKALKHKARLDKAGFEDVVLREVRVTHELKDDLS